MCVRSVVWSVCFCSVLYVMPCLLLPWPLGWHLVFLPTEGKGAGTVQSLFPWFCFCFQRAFKSFEDIWRFWEVQCSAGDRRDKPHPSYSRHKRFLLASPLLMALDGVQQLRVYWANDPAPALLVEARASICSCSPTSCTFSRHLRQRRGLVVFAIDTRPTVQLSCPMPK